MGALLKLVDKLLGTILILVAILFKWLDHFIKPKDKKVLVVRLKTLGETLLTLPTIKKLSEEGFRISVLCSRENVDVFRRAGYIHEVLMVEEHLKLLKYLKHFDYCIDTEPFSRISTTLAFLFGKKSIGFDNIFLRKQVYSLGVEYRETHAVQNFSRLLTPLGIEFKPTGLVELSYSKEEEEAVEKMLEELGLSGKMLIGVHASTGETTPWRAWKPERWSELIKRVLDGYENTMVLLTGTKSDEIINKRVMESIRGREGVIDLTGKLGLGELSCLMKKFRVFISNDTGPMHLAAAQGCRVIGLFGPNLPERFSPFGEGNTSIYKASKLSCSPCINVYRYEFRNCRFNGKCMDLISVEDVFKEVEEILKNRMPS
ncbi:MAG: glycosyltransferase family 9 protein [Candidatus Altiarchaeota archaeon]|nr:glycosyltransferase family 9 protein [Candidatus Altiarchaeota archaeon]